MTEYKALVNGNVNGDGKGGNTHPGSFRTLYSDGRKGGQIADIYNNNSPASRGSVLKEWIRLLSERCNEVSNGNGKKKETTPADDRISFAKKIEKMHRKSNITGKRNHDEFNVMTLELEKICIPQTKVLTEQIME